MIGVVLFSIGLLLALWHNSYENKLRRLRSHYNDGKYLYFYFLNNGKWTSLIYQDKGSKLYFETRNICVKNFRWYR